MRNFIYILLMVIVLPAQAGWQEGIVNDILVRQSDGLHYIYMSGSHESRPECASNKTYWMIKDENSVAGKSQFSLLLASLTTGMTIVIEGTGECSRWGDGEDIRTIRLKRK